MDQFIKNKQERHVHILAGNVVLEGDLSIPDHAIGIVLFAHGSGSSRLSPRNRFVAKELNKNKIATLLLDLLTPEEEEIDIQTAHLRFDIQLLASRLVDSTDWLKTSQESNNLNVGYFGASTGAAAALVAAAERPLVKAVVSRGGRPDLAMATLGKVKCPTLLIVGGNDAPVIDMNKNALEQLRSEKKLVIISGATHLFEERGKLEEVARYACGWFLDHLGARS